MADPKRETPKTDKPALKRRSGTGRFIFLQLVNVLTFIAAGAAVVILHERYQKSESRARASEVAHYELKRMTDTFNYRLNELREEMFHLYGEQSNLARALNESERERLIFYRRDHLAAYGIMVQNPAGGWDVQKYYVRDTAKKAGAVAQNDEMVANLKDAMNLVKPPGLGIKRVVIDPKTLGASWTGGGTGGPQSLANEAYAVAFSSADDTGTPFGVVGVFRTSYVFPFCKYFSDALGAMPVNAYVLNDKGIAVCHSQSQNDGANFKDYSFYQALMTPPPNGTVRYTNLLDNNVSSAVKKVDQGGLTFVAEAVEVSPWVSVIPYDELGMVAGGMFVVTIILAILMARLVLARGVVGRDPVSADGPPPQTDSMGVELGEFTKLRRELKDLESTVLEMQAVHAFVAGYQRAATELVESEDLARFTLDYLSSWQLPLVWLSYDSNGKKLHAGARANWSKEPGAGFQLGLNLTDHPATLAQDAELIKKLSHNLGREGIRVQPVYYGTRLLGVLVVAVKADDAEAHARLESLPELAQTFALLSRARELPK